MASPSRYAGNRRILSIPFAVALLAAFTAPAAAHHGNHSLSGNGTMQISGEMTCGADTCYAVTADFPPSGNQDLSATVSGEGMTNPNSCKDRSGSSCCMSTMILTFTVDQASTEVGTFVCRFAGTECEKPPSSPTADNFNGKLKCHDGTGYFASKTGSGKLSADIDPATGDGTVSGTIHSK